MKNKFLAAVLIIILFIPTVLAFVSYNPPFDKLTDNSSLIVSAELETPMGEKIDITDKETIKALSALLKGEQVDAIPDEAFRYNSFKTTLKGDGITEEYSVYMNVEKLEDIYFYNNDDKTPYRAKAEDGRNFASLAHAVVQARILEWVVLPSSRGSSQPRNQNCISHVS